MMCFRHGIELPRDLKSFFVGGCRGTAKPVGKVSYQSRSGFLVLDILILDLITTLRARLSSSRTNVRRQIVLDVCMLSPILGDIRIHVEIQQMLVNDALFPAEP